MKLLRFVLILGSMALSFAFVSTALNAAERGMIILDGSGSMWGRIDGSEKISVAREVLSQVLQSIPPDLSLGLMTYGHREKGNCSDIEVLVPISPDAGGRISNAAGDINPKGKTPLTAAVRQAAEALKYTEDKATVILITDGIETCNADPCALARELKKTGVGLKVHVVGFGLSAEEGRQVSCIAEETGGLYIQADNAAALGDALTDSVLEVTASEQPVAPEAEPETAEVAELPSANLDAPEQVEIARRFTVTWDGPGEKYDYVSLFDPDGNNGEGRRIRDRRLQTSGYDKRQVTLVAPVKPGPYELRYYYGAARAVIGTRAIEIIDAEVSLSALPTVDIGRRFKVEWVGPGGRRDVVQIVDPTANQGEGKPIRGKRVVNGDFDNKTVDLVAPAEPGFYRLQYWNGENNKVLATREIEVLEAEVSLGAPQSVAIGATFTVEWIGPGGRRDAVQIVDPKGNQGEGKRVREKRLTNGDFDNQKIRLPAPARPGVYELRYWNGENRTVLATRQIEVKDAEVGIDAPESVGIGSTIKVSWTGPGANRDAIQLFDPDTGGGRSKVLRSARLVNGEFEARTVKMNATAKPKQLMLRYWSGDSRLVLATRPIEIKATPVSLDGPEAAVAGESFSVSWQGPGAYRDSIQIFDPASGAKGKVLAAARLVNGDYDGRIAKIKAPKKPGNYVLRYWNADNSAVLAEVPVAIH